MVTVKYIVPVSRVAGWGCEPPPPLELIGKEVIIWRSLINWHAHRVKYKGEDFVFAHCELFDGTNEECQCGDCQNVREIKDHYQSGV